MQYNNIKKHFLKGFEDRKLFLKITVYLSFEEANFSYSDFVLRIKNIIIMSQKNQNLQTYQNSFMLLKMGTSTKTWFLLKF